ncbi:MAG TPA: hypothetical protein PLY87_26810 [Planctomycetaceae bacterium]|nr:hypothetical protein [Planctomycetaceae bacterium]
MEPERPVQISLGARESANADERRPWFTVVARCVESHRLATRATTARLDESTDTTRVAEPELRRADGCQPSEQKVTVGAENAHLTVLDKTSGTLWQQEDPSKQASNKDDVRARRTAKPIIVDGNPNSRFGVSHPTGA